MLADDLLQYLLLDLVWGLALIGAAVAAQMLGRRREGVVRCRWLFAVVVLGVVAVVASVARGFSGDWSLAVFSLLNLMVIAYPLYLDFRDGRSARRRGRS